MMHVEPRPEPTSPGFDFDGRVRQPGLNALAEMTGCPRPPWRRGPDIAKRAERIEDLKASDVRDFNYWTDAIDALHEAYGGICAYACFYIEPIHSPTVDHFEPIAMVSTAPARAYEWDNYRLACSLMNSRKREFPDVLDPFLIEDGWFVLNLGTFKVEPAKGLEPELTRKVCDTIRRLGLDSREYALKCSRIFDDYWDLEDPLPFRCLVRDTPFLAREMRRQGRVRPKDRTA